MDQCTKIAIGYILAIVLFTVLILSVRVELPKNVREDFTSESRARERRYFWALFGAPIIGLAILILAALFEGLFFLGSKAPDQLRSVGTRMRWQPPR
jgi:uncharacterized membrane protein YedE/YeeE